ncbi:GNAT family N-acetyltransferase [Aureivirga sp. CE67]|uniref:GNAT family N-acetyltransferase n=1 Tax=Aureivirga sp. CE67 TaxID=1788983 RepID=UPI0018CA2915|nr:GNAT family N-acetyltransferase [Aureivirga sp. CE67]
MKNIKRQDIGYSVSTDAEKLDIEMIHNFLSSDSSWGKGITFEKVQKSIENSLNFGLYKNNEQIGFARVISDYSTIAYVGDVFILKDHRGKGLSNLLMKEIMNHEELQNLRRWILMTTRSPWLYKKYGFTHVENPKLYMEKFNSSSNIH